MADRRFEFRTLVVLWAALALAYSIAVNHIADRPVQIAISLLYAVAVLAVTRLINARRT